MRNLDRFVLILTLLVGAYGCSAQSSEQVGAIPLAASEFKLARSIFSARFVIQSSMIPLLPASDAAGMGGRIGISTLARLSPFRRTYRQSQDCSAVMKPPCAKFSLGGDRASSTPHSSWTAKDFGRTEKLLQH
jgi:hypothetical protein